MKQSLCKAFKLAFAVVLLFAVSCQKDMNNSSSSARQKGVYIATPKEFKDFVQVNLVGDNNQYSPAHIDPNLINAWGLDFPPSGNIRIAAEGTGMSTVYTLDGNIATNAITIPGSDISQDRSHPTGDVCNPTSDFILPNGNPALLIYVSEDGAISGWNSGVSAVKMIDNSSNASYTGITIASDAGNNFLYVANFSRKKIEVYDRNWSAVNKQFSDPNLPADYSPFNIRFIDGLLYVTYAKVNPASGDEETGNGKGYMNVFSTNGTLMKRFASQGKLNAPWGVVKAPKGFWGSGSQLENMILVANFGDGHINVFDQEGNFVSTLYSHGKAIEIDGLWGIAFPPPTSFNNTYLYFAAGPGGESHGLFGYIKNMYLN
jgi:uncharacterized protein (TIGR03118 family)